MGKGFVLVLLLAMVAAAMLRGSRAQTTHVVGDALGWTVPSGGAAAYTTWAATETFGVGDTLAFNFTTGAHTVAEVSKAAFDSCNTTSPISISSNGPASIVLRSAGEHYYICTIPGHCNLGQKLAINVSGASSTSPAPQPAAASPAPAAAEPTLAPTPAAVPAPAPSPSGASGTYIVGDNLGWTVPTADASAYQTWARGKILRVGDVLVFNFANGRHNVAEVTKAAYDSCNTSSPISTVANSPARITLNRAGEHYYLCTFQGHCSLGQKLAVNVTGTAAGGATPPSTSATPPSSSATPPSSSATPPSSAFGPTAPTNPLTPSPTSPPGNSAPSLAAAFLPVTFLSIALAFLY